ncbi:class I SAM-dependent methyltransferase [Actinomadura xylanilytica]|uniref:class I SAM-dependent methyltransferase n=1 Tax=Actinomadura xylanilytica TaxID=887459 RepID=UPI00255ABE37|nr:class I SAM-dependent methyltransferase [Actinomadura xylanilytica]MDL4772327.1 class I SAM-dependent methyltransferase [Actinomadura xylanilytica]
MTDLRTPPVNDGDLFSERARQYAADKPLQRIHILEAGCGWGDGLDLGDREHRSTGVDVEDPALRAHTRARTDLGGWHLGDLRTVPMPPRAYDVVHAPFLVERVPHAELVLDRFVAAMKPGGLLLLRLRDRDTAFGFLDRRLPRRLRERLWNRLHRPARRSRSARAAGRAAARRFVPPPPAIYDRVASRQGMHAYCVMRGLVISEEYTSRDAVEALGTGSGLAGVLCRLVSALSRGRLTAAHSEVTLIIRKPENRFARVI